MLLVGLWHGASWNWILWGMWAGFFVLLDKFLWKKNFSSKIPKIITVVFSIFKMLILYLGLGFLAICESKIILIKTVQSLDLWNTSGESLEMLSYLALILIPYLTLNSLLNIERLSKQKIKLPAAFVWGTILSFVIFFRFQNPEPFFYFGF